MFLVMLKPVAVLETFFGVVVGRIAVIGFDEARHFLVFLWPQLVLRHTTRYLSSCPLQKLIPRAFTYSTPSKTPQFLPAVFAD